MSEELEENYSFAVVSLNVDFRPVTLEDITRLAVLAAGLSPYAEFSLSEHSGGGSFTIAVRETVDTGTGPNYTVDEVLHD